MKETYKTTKRKIVKPEEFFMCALGFFGTNLGFFCLPTFNIQLEVCDSSFMCNYFFIDDNSSINGK